MNGAARRSRHFGCALAVVYSGSLIAGSITTNSTSQTIENRDDGVLILTQQSTHAATEFELVRAMQDARAAYLQQHVHSTAYSIAAGQPDRSTLVVRVQEEQSQASERDAAKSRHAGPPPDSSPLPRGVQAYVTRVQQHAERNNYARDTTYSRSATPTSGGYADGEWVLTDDRTYESIAGAGG